MESSELEKYSLAGLKACLSALLGTVLLLELYLLLVDKTLRFSDGWISLLLSSAGIIVIFTSISRQAAPILILLLASLSVIFSQTSPEEFLIWEDWRGPSIRILWACLFWLFPFIFVHFSLAFPVRSIWIEKKRSRPLLLYVPYTLIVAINLLEPFNHLTDYFLLGLIFPFGFLFGIFIFIRQYVYSLTTAERNRLVIILAGSTIGFIPRFVALVVGEAIPAVFLELATFLLPFFPVSVIFAVHWKNLSELSKPVQWLLVAFFASAGVIAGSYTSILLYIFVFGSVSTQTAILISLLVAMLLIIPLQGWIRSYIANRFSFVVSRSLNKSFAPREFQKIQPNPFIVGNPVRSPEMFFGRKHEFRFIRHVISNEEQGSLIVLTGERRTGKTSILYQILNGCLGPGLVPVFFDLQGMIVENDVEFLHLLYEEIRKTVAPEARNGDQNPALRSFQSFSDFITQALQNPDVHRLLILFDEYELIEERASANKLSQEIPRFLNSLLEANPRLTLILTGSKPLSLMPYWSSLLPKSIYREISFLDRSDAEELIQVPLEGRALIKPNAMNEIIRLTNGHPFFTQLIGQVLVDLLNESESYRVDLRTIEEVANRIIEHPPPQLLYKWDTFDIEEKIVLSILAAAILNGREYLAFNQVLQTLKSLPENFRPDMNDASVQIVLERLRKRRVLDRDQTRYRFTLDLMRKWVSHEHTIWGVLKA